MGDSSIQTTRAWRRTPYVRYPIPGDHLPIHIQRAKQNEQKAHKLLLDNKLTIAVGHYQQQWQTTETTATTLLVYFHTTSLECWFTTTEAFRSRTGQCIKDKDCHHWPLFIQQTTQTAQSEHS